MSLNSEQLHLALRCKTNRAFHKTLAAAGLAKPVIRDQPKKSALVKASRAWLKRGGHCAAEPSAEDTAPAEAPLSHLAKKATKAAEAAAEPC